MMTEASGTASSSASPMTSETGSCETFASFTTGANSCTMSCDHVSHAPTHPPTHVWTHNFHPCITRVSAAEACETSACCSEQVRAHARCHATMYPHITNLQHMFGHTASSSASPMTSATGATETFACCSTKCQPICNTMRASMHISAALNPCLDTR